MKSVPTAGLALLSTAPAAARHRGRSRLQSRRSDKIEVVRQLRAAKSKEESDYPIPDLAIEVDISPPKIDRPGIYAAMGVTELWRFDDDTPLIDRLGVDGQYIEVDQSVWLPVRVEHLRRWVVEEDSSDFADWSRAMGAGSPPDVQAVRH